MGRFLHALGIGAGDIVQNCFSYHLVPAGMMFENAARAVGAAVLPAGTGQTELQVRAAPISAPPPMPARRTS
jgi:phenylacetate-CoA ligase